MNAEFIVDGITAYNRCIWFINKLLVLIFVSSSHCSLAVVILWSDCFFYLQIHIHVQELQLLAHMHMNILKFRFRMRYLDMIWTPWMETNWNICRNSLTDNDDTPSASSDDTDRYENDAAIVHPDQQFEGIQKSVDKVIYVNVAWK